LFGEEIDVDRDYWSGHVMQLKAPGGAPIRLPFANGPKLTGGKCRRSWGHLGELPPVYLYVSPKDLRPGYETITSAWRPLTSSTFI